MPTPMTIQQEGVVDSNIDYTSYSVAELKQMCKEKGLKGYSKKTEQELIEMIQGME